MALRDSISRLASYYRRHGCEATLWRAVLSVRRTFSSDRFVVYCYDFSGTSSVGPPLDWPACLTVDRVTRLEEINEQDCQKIVGFWNPRLSARNLSQRFERGATIWLARSAGNLAGYGWTLIGQTMKPHFFPFSSKDVHFFDFVVFPEHRGNKINPLLVRYILNYLSAEGRSRAYIEVAEWNTSQLASLSKTGFQRIGVARNVSFFGRTFIEWTARKEASVSEGIIIPQGSKRS